MQDRSSYRHRNKKETKKLLQSPLQHSVKFITGGGDGVGVGNQFLFSCSFPVWFS